MVFKHCLIVLSLCLSTLGATLQLDEYDYEEVFRQLKATDATVPTEATVFTTTPVPVLDRRTTPVPVLDNRFDFDDYSTSDMFSDDSNTLKGKIVFIVLLIQFIY